MAVDNPDVVDMIGTTPDEKGVCLIISDHLDWDDTPQHLGLLQTKINRYLAYIQSEDFLEQYPNAQEKPAHIEVCCAFPPSADGERFLNLARDMISRAGWSFAWQVIPARTD